MAENLKAVGSMLRYRKWIFETIAPYLGKEILEAGCGNGNLSSMILTKPDILRFTGVDHDALLCDQLRHSLMNLSSEWSVIHSALESPEFAQLEEKPYDTIVCLNVLEHIQDDVAMLKTFNRLLKPGGRLILLVPAFQWLYGTIDAAIHHYRRYGQKDIAHKLKAANLATLVNRPFNLFGIPAWIWHGKILKLSVHHHGEMRSWDKWVPLLSRVENTIRPPIGLSFFVVAEKAAQ